MRLKDSTAIDRSREAKLVSLFLAEGIDMKPINDPEVVRLLLGQGYTIPPDVP